MDSEQPAGNPGEEVEVWWGSYAARTLTPSFLTCGVLTLVISGGTWTWSLGVNHGNLENIVLSFAHVLVGLIWAVQAARWGYRVTGVNYRLTTRRLFRDWGFQYPGEVRLDEVTLIVVERSPWERWLGIGKVRVHTGRAAALILEGVKDPEQVAVRLRHQVEAARAFRLRKAGDGGTMQESIQRDTSPGG